MDAVKETAAQRRELPSEDKGWLASRSAWSQTSTSGSPTGPTLSGSRHWMQAVSHLDPKFGGVSAVVPQLSEQLRRDGLAVEIASFSAHDESFALSAYPELKARHWPASRGAWLKGPALRAGLRREMSEADGIHIHGLWETQSLVAARMARSLHKPYIVSAHGMLERWALAHKRHKKQIYSALFERSHIEHAACLHALTRAEAEDYRRFGSRRPIAIIPNGINLPARVDRSVFLERYPELRGKRMILFLGRLHFKKGLDILVQAWSEIAARFPDAVLVLAGPEDAETQAALAASLKQAALAASLKQAALAASLKQAALAASGEGTDLAAAGGGSRVVFTGMLEQEMKWSALAQAHCFTLPSYSEGLSVAVLEALGMGVPVLISDCCNLPEVQQANAGWVIPATRTALTSALTQVLTQSADATAEMGSNGRRLVQERFSWPVVGGQMAELYDWVLGGGPVAGGARPRSFELLEAVA